MIRLSDALFSWNFHTVQYDITFYYGTSWVFDVNSTRMTVRYWTRVHNLWLMIMGDPVDKGVSRYVLSIAGDTPERSVQRYYDSS